MDIKILRPEASSQKAAPKYRKMCVVSCVQHMVSKGPMDPIFIEIISKKDPFYFALAIQKLYSLRAG